MKPTDELSRKDLILLTGGDEIELKCDLQNSNMIHWSRPIFPRRFIAIDAVLSVLFRLFCKEFNLKMTALRWALPGMQFRLPAGVDRRGTEMMVALDRCGHKIAVDCGTPDELEASGLFKRRKYPAHFRLPVALATSAVRERAKQHNIALPATFAPDVPPFLMRSAPFKYNSPDGKVISEWSPAALPNQLPKGIVN
jgi:hypothetical protein